GGVLTGPGRQHLAHDDGVDALRGNAGPFERAGDGEAAELGRRERGQRPFEPSLPGAGSGNDDDVVGVHETTLRAGARASGGSVAAITSAMLTPGAVSIRTRPSVVTSITARSVMIRSTTARPVSGRLQASTILGEPSFATCSMRTMTRPA